MSGDVTGRIEHLLSAPLYLAPQLIRDRIYFISNISGRLSLYAMDDRGSVPEPLLPPDVALLTPDLLDGEPFVALPDLGVIVVMMDRAGDENHQPCVVPIDGGDPKPFFGDRFAGQQVTLVELDQNGRGTISVDPRVRAASETYEIDVSTRDLLSLGASPYVNFPVGHTDDRSRYLLIDQYTYGDTTLWLRDREADDRRLLYGVPLDDRTGEQAVPLNGFEYGWFVADDRAVVVHTTLFDDLGGLGTLVLSDPESIAPVEIVGTGHPGAAQLERVRRLTRDRFLLTYNADGASWGYDATLDVARRRLQATGTVFGQSELSGGVVQRVHHDPASDRFVVAFSSATTPAQLATVTASGEVTLLTRNRILGVDAKLLSPGEDASYESHDGMRVSARLYLPSPELGFAGPRPVVHYIHGGPQDQERPDFTWFSMPLIQHLTLHGFAVFVPNVRGSSGYGQEYMKQVDRDWGGQDRLDHVAGVAHLGTDPRVDADRIGVMGRSYGGYMTLMLAGRHPEIWSAAVDMFGPYDLLVWTSRLPEAWQVYFRQVLGAPETEEGRAELVARSPRTYLGELACPLLVVQGANDPRVVQAESDNLVEQLRNAGKTVDYLVFDDEGHDVTRLPNKVRCYQTITDFFVRHLRP